MNSISTSEGGTAGRGLDFIRKIIKEDLESGRVDRVVTRFPPEPNGYLHIGHAKAFILNFSVAKEFGGVCRLRYDDTNPEKESEEYVRGIERDIKWFGFSWDSPPRYASDYFEQFYAWAVELVKAGKAYVDHQNPQEIRLNRGTPTKVGQDSPYRNRSVKENLDLLERMRKGEFAEGECVLRSKISMSHPNILMRDPTMYRIRHVSHHRTGRSWPIYPMYDFAHGYEDAIEGVSHSLCSLEFENHRPLYDWFLDNVKVPSRPRQYEFARLYMGYTVMSKRFLRRLVEEKYVHGWDDPRMPTICGLRRRGYTPSAIRRFVEELGVSKVNSLVDVNFLHFIIREELNREASRRMAVLHPLKMVLINYPQDQEETILAENIPGVPQAGTRSIPFGRELWVEREDYMDSPPRKWFRLAPGREVRLKYAYFVTVEEVVRNSAGELLELRCRCDFQSRGGESPDGRKVKGTLHWVSAARAIDLEVRLYDYLLTLEDPNQIEEGKDFLDYINPASETILTGVKGEPSLILAEPEQRFQFLRQGYFVADNSEHKTGSRGVFNRVVGLKDSWGKIKSKGAAGQA